jgi:hypothetical protein
MQSSGPWVLFSPGVSYVWASQDHRCGLIVRAYLISYSDRNAIAAALRPIYTAATEAAVAPS